MAEYKFSSVQRFVIFTVYGPETKCYLCNEPVTLKTMQVDHIIPEQLLSHPARLAEVIEELGLSKSFELNSYENWLPSCGPCNNAKRNNVYRPAPMYLGILKRADDNAEKCRNLELKWKTKARIENALFYLEAAAENDELDFSQLEPLISAFVGANPKLLQEMIAGSGSGGDRESLSFIQTTTFAVSPKLSVVFAGGMMRAVRD